jgi:hypothetical protein
LLIFSICYIKSLRTAIAKLTSTVLAGTVASRTGAAGVPRSQQFQDVATQWFRVNNMGRH